MRRRDLLSGVSAAGALALTAAPFAARAQAPGRTYRIAVWSISRSVAEMGAEGTAQYRAFFAELRRIGFVEGRNLTVDRYGDESRPERYEPTARAIVESKPDLIFPNGTRPAAMLKTLSSTIPVVVPSWTDPVGLGLIQSLARPGGNLTGFTADGGIEVYGLRLQILKEAVPKATRLAYLTVPDAPVDQAALGMLTVAASQLGVELYVHAMRESFDQAGYRSVFAELSRQKVDGLFVGTAAEHLVYRKLVIDMAAAAKLPTLYGYREFADDGGLMAYGGNLVDVWAKCAGYVARILNGEKAGDLPVQQPTVFDMIVNLKTAKALGITLPETIFFRATEVIE